jgi:hypothetical protein
MLLDAQVTTMFALNALLPAQSQTSIGVHTCTARRGGCGRLHRSFGKVAAIAYAGIGALAAMPATETACLCIDNNV